MLHINTYMVCTCSSITICVHVHVHVHVCTCSSTFKCGEITLCSIFGRSLPACSRLLRCLLQTLHQASERVDTGTRKKEKKKAMKSI